MHVSQRLSLNGFIHRSIFFSRVTVWPLLKEIVEHIKNMLEFPNIQCSQNAMTAAGNLLVSIHKMVNQTQIQTEKELVQNGKHFQFENNNQYQFEFSRM